MLLLVSASTVLAAERFARGRPLTIDDKYVETYVTCSIEDSIVIRNQGPQPVSITGISSSSADFVDWFFQLDTSCRFPFTIPAGDSVAVGIVFTPNPHRGEPFAEGRRDYEAIFDIVDSTNAITHARVTGHGFMVDMTAFIDRRWVVPPGQLVIVDVVLAQWVDSLRLSDWRGFIFEMRHYRRSVLWIDTLWEFDSVSRVGTLSEGAEVATNFAENHAIDSMHNLGEQGYYELNVRNARHTLAQPGGTLLRLRFVAVRAGDTSELTYGIRGLQSANGELMDPWINAQCEPGLVTVDSIDGFGGVQYVGVDSPTLESNEPNPAEENTVVTFHVPYDEHVLLTLFDAAGQAVASPVDQVMARGTYRVPVETAWLRNGLYLLCLTTNEGILYRRMIVVH